MQLTLIRRGRGVHSSQRTHTPCHPLHCPPPSPGAVLAKVSQYGSHQLQQTPPPHLFTSPSPWVDGGPARPAGGPGGPSPPATFPPPPSSGVDSGVAKLTRVQMSHHSALPPSLSTMVPSRADIVRVGTHARAGAHASPTPPPTATTADLIKLYESCMASGLQALSP